MGKFGLNFFKPTEKFNGNWSILESKSREWEKMYRERWSHDKEVRTTHGVNCTGSCSWKVFVKNGVITWENQQTDYPSCGPDMPEYEPRGCPRGASFSWYEYSPLRIKYPYIRGKLWDLWTEALEENNGNRVAAWASIVENEDKAKQYKQARGMGGHVRSNWKDVTDIIAAQLLYTIKKYGPDRIAGFTPIPAMSMISYAAGARFINLLGGEMLSFYDWYADLPPASPQIWGEQTDVPESSDWYNASYIIMWGSNVPLTRTPDAHFMTEVRYKGTKVISVAPDYAENVKFADNWLAPNPGSDAAIAQAMTHVILQEHYVNQPNERFINYAKQYTDMPFIIMLDEDENGYKAGRFLRASDLGQTTEQGEWKPVIHDAISDSLVVPNGTMGQRWEEGKKWNLKLETEDGSKINPTLSMTEGGYELETIQFPYFDSDGDGIFERPIPTRQVTLANGDKVRIATIFDLMASQYGVRRFNHELESKGYDDAESKYTPSWQEAISGVKQSVVIQVAKEFAQNAIDTEGRSMIIMGAGINHWFNSDTIYRSILNLVMLCGCQGVNGGGWAHYVGQEKCRPIEGWSTVAFAKDWQGPPRLQNGTSWFYFATDQWKYEESNVDRLKSPLAKTEELKHQHPADYNVLAARLGWLPSYPQFNKNSLLFAEEAKDEGIDSNEEILQRAIDEVKSKQTQFAIEDPDLKKNHPKSLFIWRSNLISSSAKGQEYFMKHLLGTKSGLLATPNEDDKPEEIKWREETTGKLDLVVSLDFRMTATPLYSDIVLPAATWYEKHDLSSTDMHPYVHPFNPAIDPLWESRSDWDIYKTLAKAFSEMAKDYLPGTFKDVVITPLSHDTKQEISTPYGVVKDWSKGEIEAVPGRTMPNFAIVERDYTKIYDKYVTLGPVLEKGKVGAHGVSFGVSEQYEELKSMLGTWSDRDDDSVRANRPRIDTARNVADAILSISSATNGKLSQKSYENLEEQTGMPLKDISSERAAEKILFLNITSQPREVIPTAVFPGSNKQGRRYSPFTTNIERLVPFRTLTGRQSYYVDHEVFQQFGESLPVYKPTLPPMVFGNRDKKIKGGTDALVLRYLTPHGKWNIHSMYQDNKHMLTLFRGGPTVWISNEDAEKHDIHDNDWLEVYNRNGVVTARAVISHRMPKGTMFMYHAQDKHIQTPGSEITDTRGGSHNAPTRIHLKPTQLVGGYAQISYHFNYYGPIGNQRDLYVAVRKMKEVNWLED
ncbi:TPA: nitrate reductase subunit alpha [Staphylococcus argenteus]|uniref:nitrate reductase subunit alpha n=1 Tax=Staphylococcus argenteus TaxID=985002 RepID=UPI000234009E|nr:nitrate reductase subunit alpha [Staphylococcus argenteus]MBE2130695.1 nitrate reductase subunit alpha [Staphylococcus argenteus]PNY94226.1 nitrate reductase subunit alpha [Staphylococcus argenteus]CCE60052.1 nitrate reductase alpha chain [Staphylococcus argenteus]SUJ25367.1 Respiratory nitrate reductase alpha chain [Staphylococcus argenteus]HDY9428699.1 nitrate reductase subunit alpha [Staphylococcus argenteus]